MDITQHLRVLARFHRVIIAAVLLGVALAVLFTFKVSISGGPKLEYRHAETWRSDSTLFVTQQGFPWGRTTLPGDPTGQSGSASKSGQGAGSSSFADPSRLSLLATIYSFITSSNAIAQINSPLPPGGKVTAQELSSGNNDSLPLFKLSTEAQTQPAANTLNFDRTNALRRYLADQQARNKVPAAQRVEVSVLNSPQATRVASHGGALAVAVVFLAACAGIAAAYLLESMRLSRERKEAGRVAAHLARGPAPSDPRAERPASFARR